MFVGLHHHVLDEKGRLAFPASLRASLNEQGANDRFYLTVSFYESCLQVTTEEDFQVVADKVRALPPSNPAVSEFKRVVIASASLISIDKAGRVSVPKELRDYASLERDAVWAGVIDKIELWSKARWDERTANRLQDRQFLEEARQFFEPHGI
jgi:MraZ protein